jgi:hypothetical protein
MKFQLLTERGEVLEEELYRGAVIDHLIPQVSDDTSPCWRFIDPYGDTVFNTLQMGRTWPRRSAAGTGLPCR